jgi:hypothetical protein
LGAFPYDQILPRLQGELERLVAEKKALCVVKKA